MTAFHKAIKLENNGCPPDCDICRTTCLERFAFAGSAGVKRTCLPELNLSSAVMCAQCSEPACEASCPTGAITKNPETGIVKINQTKCLGCGLCSLVCPYGGIEYNPATKFTVKCDLCGGDPECVKACPHGVLKLIDHSPIDGFFQIEDPLSKGVPMCPGCASEIAHRFTMRILGKDVVLIGAPGCGCAMMLGVETPLGIRSPESVPTHMALLTNVASVMSGMSRYYKKVGKNVKVVSFVGDGATVDIGFQALSGAAERGENILYICYDNEAYMNTGIQRSGTTPLGAWTTTSEVGPLQQGKGKNSKNAPLLIALHGGVSYAATATIGYPLDYARKLKKAMEVADGLAYLHLFSPCHVGWRAGEDTAIGMCEAAVETNYFPLWEAEYGKFRITHQVKDPKPIEAFTKLAGRFKHLGPEDLKDLQRLVDQRFETIHKLTL